MPARVFLDRGKFPVTSGGKLGGSAAAPSGQAEETGGSASGAAFGDGDTDETRSPPRDRVRSENRDLLR